MKIEYQDGDIKDYEIRVLAENNCASFLPVSFFRNGEHWVGEYDESGYRRLSDCQTSQKEILQIIENIAMEYKNVMGFPINAEKMRLDADHIFVGENGFVKFTFELSEDECENFNHNLAQLLEEIIDSHEDFWLIKSLQEYVITENPSPEKIANKACLLRREIVPSAWD